MNEIHLPYAAPNFLIGFYFPLFKLKISPKGIVRLGFNPKRCSIELLKQGKGNFKERIKWEYEVLKNLNDKGLPIPQAKNYIEYRDCAFVAMQFLTGTNLKKKLADIRKNRSWKHLDKTVQGQLLAYYLEILQIVNTLHIRGWVYRDIYEQNFILHNGKVHLFDFEMAYNLNGKSQLFFNDNPGFVPPEQKQQRTPTTKEDIFNLGLLLSVMISGTEPGKFIDYSDLTKTKNKLFNLLHERTIPEIIVECLHPKARNRPTIKQLHETVRAFINDHLFVAPEKHNLVNMPYQHKTLVITTK